MTGKSACDTPARVRTLLTYVTLCVTVLIGSIGIRWYLHVASTKAFAEMRKNEESAAKAGAAQLVVIEVEARDILEKYHRVIALLVGVCLVAAATGLAQALYHMWLSPSAQTGLEVCLPRPMLLVLTWQVTALCITAALVQFWFG